MRILLLSVAFLTCATSCGIFGNDDTDSPADDIDTGTSSPVEDEVAEEACAAITACAEDICTDVDDLIADCIELSTGTVTQADVEAVATLSCDQRNEQVCLFPGAADVCDCTQTGGDSCPDIYDCLVECGDNPACAQDCLGAGSAEGEQRILALLTCLNDACGTITDPEAFQDCADDNCSSELTQCFGRSAQASSQL